MSIEFNSFYKSLKKISDGSEDEMKNFKSLLSSYESKSDCKNCFDELGMTFCCNGIKYLYEYTGLKELNYISNLKSQVWEYLEKRVGKTLTNYLVSKLVDAYSDKGLKEDLAQRWEVDEKEIERNIEPLALYVVEGIIEVIQK